MDLGMEVDKKEEGEISLDDVSSPEEAPQYTTSWWTRSMRTASPRIHGRREVDIPLQDAVHGKENRRHARGNFPSTKFTVAKLQEKNDLLPISSDEEVEFVSLPGSSHQLPIRCGKIRRKKKKKKKGPGGDGNLSINDYVSLVDPEPDMIPINITHGIIRQRRSPSPVLKRRRSPAGKAREYSSRSSPRSYRPNFRYSMEIGNSRSTSPKKSLPRKIRSPRRSPSVTSRGGSSPEQIRKKNSAYHVPDGYNELYAKSLLKRVRHLDAVGTIPSVSQQKMKEGPSLKEKLSMMDNHMDVPENVGMKKEKEIKSENVVKDEPEEEEDLELLRRQALGTKKSIEEVSDSKPESGAEGNTESADRNEIDRQDGIDDLEDLELRLIALRSAVLKKYQDRVKNGGPRKIRTHREESPFSDSFLYQNTSEEQSGSAASSISWSPMSQSPDYPESNTQSPHVEEIEEKKVEIDSPPYSPTDDVMSQTQMESELAEKTKKLIQEYSLGVENILPEFETPYSPSGTHLSGNNSSSSVSITGDLDIEDNSSFERLVEGDPGIPYSPTDPLFTLPCDSGIPEILEHSEPTPQPLVRHPAMKEISKEPEINEHPLDEDLSKLMPLDFLRDGSASPNDSLITIDEIQEMQEEQQQQHPLIENSESTNVLSNTDDNSIREMELDDDEPLYLQGVPDVTKDANKIPTLINRSLVPATILKTNKKLQQPLPSKKIDQIVEPAFISATMQPVDFDIEKSVSSNAIFKPIKLQPVTKKPVVIASPAAVFNTSTISEENVEVIGKNHEADSKIAKNVEVNIQKITSHEIPTPSEKVNPENKVIVEDVKKKKRSHSKKSSKKSPQKKQTKLYESSAVTGDENRVENSRTNKHDVEKLTKNIGHRKGEETNKKSVGMKEEELRERLEAKRKRRSKSTHRSEHEKQSKLNIKNDVVSEKSDEKILSEREKHKSLGTSKSKKNEKEKKDPEEKRRRASMEDDEEALRALLLASLPKRQKKTEIPAPKVLEMQGKTPENTEKRLTGEELKKSTISEGIFPKTLTTASRVVLPARTSLSPNNLIVSVTNVVNSTDKPTACLPEVPEAKKRTATVVVNAPPTKFLRKVTIPSSAIPANNTKTLQSAMNQKNMIAQNVAKAPATVPAIRNMTINNVKMNENVRPSSPKLFSARNCRLVINLGEDSDTDSDSSSEKGPPTNDPRDGPTIPEPDFEKSLEAFLKDQRKKQESVAAISRTMTSTPLPAKKPSSSKKLTGLASTPLAVRHLSASRQEEYRRLKQQILERERQKLHRTIENNLQTLGNKINNTSLTPPGPLSPASPINKPNKLSPVATIIKALETDAKTPATNNQQNSNVDEKNAQNTGKTGEENASISISTGVVESVKKPMENLSIQIPNDNVSTIGRSVEIKNVSEEENVNRGEDPVQTAPVLRILTSDQVNMKFSDNNIPHLVEESPSNPICQLPVVGTLSRELHASQIADENRPIELSARENPEPSLTGMNKSDSSIRPIEHQASEVISHTEESILEAIAEDPNATIVLDDSLMEGSAVEKESSANNNPAREILKTPVKKSPAKSRSNKSPAKELSDKIKSDVKVEMETFTSLCEEEQKKKLIEIEQQLVDQRYAVLDDLTQMTDTLKQWDIERELQSQMAAEVKRLRNQLKVAEERLQKQRGIISQMGPKVTKAHVTIINHRAECHKLTKLCQGIGIKVAGQDYKVPSTCQQLMIDRLKQVAFHTRQLSQKKLPSTEPNKQTHKKCDTELSSASSDMPVDPRITRLSADSDHSMDSQSNHSDDVLDNNLIRRTDQCDSSCGEVASGSIEEGRNFSTLNEDACLPDWNNIPGTSGLNKEILNTLEKSQTNIISSISDEGEPLRPVSTYKSVLTGFKSLGHIDPNRVLCPYELMGICGDEGCPYNHLDTNRSR